MCEFIGCPGLENHPSSLGSKHQVNIVFYTWSIKFLGLWLPGTRAWRGGAARAIKPCSACSSKALCRVSELFGAFSSCKDPSETSPDSEGMLHFPGALCSSVWEELGVLPDERRDGTRVSLTHTKQGSRNWAACRAHSSRESGEDVMRSCWEAQRSWLAADWHQECAGDTGPSPLAVKPAKHKCRRGAEQMLQGQSSPVNACDTLTVLVPQWKWWLIDFLLSKTVKCYLCSWLSISCRPTGWLLWQENQAVPGRQRILKLKCRRRWSNIYSSLLHEFISVLYLNAS